ncbi:MAG: division plane positioning ATPase MipZ [Rickettsiales bacterium]|jgi:chromosome partitioning protein|nr:division plane positioning ATPase MipZ [Rickettsiales bacterium]
MTQTYIIVIGNEKGVVGKTTSSVHLIVSLLYLGLKLSSIDADCRQQSLSRYLANQASYALKHNANSNVSKIHHPKHFAISASLDSLLDKKTNKNNLTITMLISRLA